MLDCRHLATTRAQSGVFGARKSKFSEWIQANSSRSLWRAQLTPVFPDSRIYGAPFSPGRRSAKLHCPFADEQPGLNSTRVRGYRPQVH